MRVVILAGGLGTRLAEETEVKPKPMVEIGGYPILWHIMKLYSFQGYSEFIIALGYKGDVIKRYFMEYTMVNSDISIDLKRGSVKPQLTKALQEDWTVHLVDTGLNTLTGGRVLKLKSWLDGETFMVTYGDGVSNIDLRALVSFHHSHGRLATVTAVRPPARYGGLIFDGDIVAQFTEKPQTGEGWINGGFLVFNPGIFDYLEDDQSSLEVGLLEKLAENKQLAAYKHDSFWQCMDTLRDKRLLESLWQNGAHPWKIWS